MPLPNYATYDKSTTDTLIRLLLVGPPGSGKTCAAATFPNPLFLNFDNNLKSAEILLGKSFANLPFYDEPWIRTQYPKLHPTPTSPLKVSSALTTFLNSAEIAAMTQEDTLVIDSLSTLGDAVFKDITAITPKSSKTGEADGHWFWKTWAEYFCALCTKLKSLRCHVVLIAHENEIRDSETGRVISYKFVLQGQLFSPRLPQFFTDMYRQTLETKPLAGGSALDKTTLRVEENYLWQIKTSTLFLCKTRIRTQNQFVKAHYKSIQS